ncbi:MAG: TetR family transcriptional regulator [Dermatophilaceae bacterium]
MPSTPDDASQPVDSAPVDSAPVDSAPASHREEKKARTRHRIHDEAMRLFAERGYSATTVADIAQAADIAPRTFFGYFPTKEALLFERLDALIALLEQVLADRPHGGTALEELQFAIRTAFADDHWWDDRHDAALTVAMADNARATTYGLTLEARMIDALAAAVASDLGVAPTDFAPRMVAAATLAALQRVSSEPLNPGSDGAAQLDQVLTFVRAGARAIGIRLPHRPIQPSEG